MTDKVTLATITSFKNDTTAVTQTNANNALITTAIDNTLSRNGTQPNSMGANLDMNSNHILNLPAPMSSTEPVRVSDINTFVSGGTITFNNVPTGGTSGQVLTKNSSTNFDTSWQNQAVASGGTVNQFLHKNSSTNFDTSWQNLPYFNVMDYGATGNGSTDDTVALQNAINAVQGSGATHGGYLWFPPGTYIVSGNNALNLTSSGNVHFRGSGMNATYIAATTTDTNIVNINGGQTPCSFRDMSFIGFGGDPSNLTAPFAGSATRDVFIVNGVGSFQFDNLNIVGGRVPLSIVNTSGNMFKNCRVYGGYGFTNCNTSGNDYFVNVFFDQTFANTTANVTTNNNSPYVNWAASTAYTAGNIVYSQSFIMKCTTSGTSGGSPPTLKNYGLTIIDGSARWTLIAPQTQHGFTVNTGGATLCENHLVSCDFTGAYDFSIYVNQNGQLVVIDADLGSGISVVSGLNSANTINIIENSLVAGLCNIQSGNFIFDGNGVPFSNCNLEINNAINNVIVANNLDNSRSSSVGVAVGADHYNIVNNIGFTVTDNSTNTHKTISGNN